MAESTTPRHKVGPELARSWLLVNASQPETFADAMASEADIVILDIEDAVAPEDKLAARQNVLDFFAAGGDAWVRINGFGTSWWEGDCEALAALPGCHGVMLAMVETSEHVQRTVEKLGEHQKIVAMVETARGMMLVDRIAQSRGTYRIAFGLGDFRRDTGIADDEAALAFPRSQLTIASRAAGLPGPIDGPTPGALGDELTAAARLTEKFGMRGKICLDPAQCPTVNAALAPSHDDIEWAKAFLADFEARGGRIRSGADLPKLARARRGLERAAAFGINS